MRISLFIQILAPVLNRLGEIAALSKNRIRVLINMESGARPLVILGLINHFGPYRIVLDITHRSIDMGLIEHAGKESPLPQMTVCTAFLVEILEYCAEY